jgi:hypothetical protein
MSMPDLRCYSMAAVVEYDKTGKLIGDLLDDFKYTVEGTIAPNPVAVSEVLSPAALTSAASSQMMTHVRSIDRH